MNLVLVKFIIYVILRIYQGIMGLSIIFSWIPAINYSKFGILVNRVSDWYLGYFGNFLSFGGIDFTPMIALVLYDFIIQQLLF